MASTTLHAVSASRRDRSAERWLFTAIALAMIATSLASFLPSIAYPAGRRGPVSAIAVAHGLACFLWLLLFLVQSMLIATRHRSLHRIVGFGSVFLLVLMVPLSYETTILMVRRGFDLSGDLHIDHDPRGAVVFPLCNLLIFSVLAVTAIGFRSRPELHKRLILFANIELMPAPLAHFIGHAPWLAALPGAIVMVPISIFVLAAVARDLLDAGRVHPLTWALALLRIVSGPLEAGPIGTSAGWHNFVYWLAR